MDRNDILKAAAENRNAFCSHYFPFKFIITSPFFLRLFRAPESFEGMRSFQPNEESKDQKNTIQTKWGVSGKM